MSAVQSRIASAGALLSCLILCASTLTGAQNQNAQQPGREGQAEIELNAGLQAYQSGQLEKAISRLRRASAIAPDNPHVRLYLGLFLYEQDRDSTEAQRYMESAMNQFPSHSDLQLRLLDSYLRSRNEEKIEALIHQLKSKMATDSRFAFNAIYTLIHYGQLGMARSELETVSGNLQGEVLFIGALIALGSGENAEALDLLQGATRHNFPPRESKQMLTMADSFFKLSAFPPAARAYEAFLENHADAAPTTRLQLGLSYFGYGDFERALEQLQRVKKDAPETPEIDLQLGRTLIELNRALEARPFLEAELKRNPSSYKAMTKMAYLAYLDGQNDLCRRWLDKSIAESRQWFETHMVYGLLYVRLGEYEKAVSNLELCIREEPEYPRAYFQLSSVYRRMGNEEKANQFLERFNQLQNAAISNTQKALGLQDKPPQR